MSFIRELLTLGRLTALIRHHSQEDIGSPALRQVTSAVHMTVVAGLAVCWFPSMLWARRPTRAKPLLYHI
jgi:hypothetical protein